MKKYLFIIFICGLSSCSDFDFRDEETILGLTNPNSSVKSFSFSVDTNDTRLYYNGNFVFEEGDIIGACLMDRFHPDYPGDLWSKKFSFTSFIQSNYPFSRDADGIWTTESKLSEGNYFMVYPYNSNYSSRCANVLSVEEQQYFGQTKDELYKSFAKNNHYIGYSKVLSGSNEGESVRIRMIPVFGATTIELHNNGSIPYNIERIVLKGNKVVLSAVLDPTSCDPLVQFNGSGSTSFNAAQYTQDLDGALYSQTNLTEDGVYYPMYKGAEKYDSYKALKDVLQYGSPSALTVDYHNDSSLGANGSFKTVVMTAEASIDSNVSGQVLLSIYTDKGVIEDIDLAAPHANDPYTHISTDKVLPALGAGKKIVVSFDDSSFQKPMQMDISSADDLLNLMKWNTGMAGATLYGYLDGDIHITKEVYDEYSRGKFWFVNLTGPYKVIFDEDVPAKNMSGLKFDHSVNVIVKGSATMPEDPGFGAGHLVNGRDFTIQDNVRNFDYIENFGNLIVDGSLDKTIINNYPGASVTLLDGSIVKGINNIHTEWWEPLSVVNITGKAVTDLHNYSCVNISANGVIEGIQNEESGYICNKGRITKCFSNGKIYALGASTTSIISGTEGFLDITELGPEGNISVPSGYIVSQCKAGVKYDQIDSRANALFLSGILDVSTDDKSEEIDLPYIKAFSINSKVEGNCNGKVKVDKGIEVAKNCKINIQNISLGSNLPIKGEDLTAAGCVGSSVKTNGYTVTGSSITLENYSL